ncbi:chemotaxis protein CheW [Alkaliphilus peptidifermentans]|uniref:Purine-binding chemotaxis protein CheW n=1 Tax=Alkaliphilus peptidifermentans DSM 18978 TaxID=1120976 RepID=A0A1G5CRV4_9FIRM|nr:chemotaxis protein CheW [Alkaliphilus peptidifermentans]SCY04998.1 purine-binding chemotaxis protein CheW [Alkaliphilus peptidifermentans DSM 18978]
MAERQYVIFKLDKEEYGVDIMHVKEISEFKESVKIPNSPKFVDGIINYRGVITPIINLRRKFHLELKENTADVRIIIINLSEKQVGFIVDDASQVLTIDEKDIDPAPDLIADIDQRFISGIAKVDERMVILLDLEKVLSEEEKKNIEMLDNM